YQEGQPEQVRNSARDALLAALGIAVWSRGQVQVTAELGSALPSIRSVNLALPCLGKCPGEHLPCLHQSGVCVAPDHEHHLVTLAPDRDYLALGAGQP